jgi:hypothetical protein
MASPSPAEPAHRQTGSRRRQTNNIIFGKKVFLRNIFHFSRRFFFDFLSENMLIGVITPSEHHGMIDMAIFSPLLHVNPECRPVLGLHSRFRRHFSLNLRCSSKFCRCAGQIFSCDDTRRASRRRDMNPGGSPGRRGGHHGF